MYLHNQSSRSRNITPASRSPSRPRGNLRKKSGILDSTLASTQNQRHLQDEYLALWQSLIGKLHSSSLECEQFTYILDNSSLFDDDLYLQPLIKKLRIAIADIPVEDGIFHSSEEILRNALTTSNDIYTLDLLQELIADERYPHFVSSVLLCLSRLDPGTQEWRANIIETALHSKHLELRDAAVQAAEIWADKGTITILKNHNDDVDWLQDYICEVVDILNE